MAKFYGIIGYAKTVETEPGIWTEEITERRYYGDLVRNNSRYQQSGGVNDDIVLSNNISIENYLHIRYVELMGVKCKVTNVDVQYPRLILTTGGVYNE